jgi:Kef-type K+ transport system membrane component KefB
LIGPLLLPGKDANTYLFLGAALAATSVGITGRVFRDLGKLGLPEAQVVLGAAVIDDVLGLVILAVVSSLVQAGTVSFGEVGWIITKAVLFLAGSIVVGRAVAPHSSKWLARLDKGQSMLFAQVLATGLFLAWLAHVIGLAPIIGAFAAGLLFEPVFLRDFETPKVVQEIAPLLPEGPRNADRIRQVLDREISRQHEHLIEPIGYFFVPVFFVLTGMQVDLGTLADLQVVGIALGTTVVAVAGKLAAGFAAGRGYSPWLIGWGMVPRGEVGLIFAMAGRQLGVVSESLFSVIVIMVILTTLLTPPILTALLRRG